MFLSRYMFGVSNNMGLSDVYGFVDPLVHLWYFTSTIMPRFPQKLGISKRGGIFEILTKFYVSVRIITAA